MSERLSYRVESPTIIAGYEVTGVHLPPPEFDRNNNNRAVEIGSNQSNRYRSPDLPSLSSEDCEAELFNEVSRNSCWRKGTGSDLEIAEIWKSTAFRLSVETYTEGRTSSWAHEPFLDQIIDGPENGEAPNPWDLPAEPREFFEDEEVQLEVPHTAEVKFCHNCDGKGVFNCPKCHGAGVLEHEGYSQPCYTCGGQQKVVCHVCRGVKYLKRFIQLTISWSNCKDEYISQSSEDGVPNDLLEHADGKRVFNETGKTLNPVKWAKKSNITAMADYFLKGHIKYQPTVKVLSQRQSVTAIPIAECIYKWKDEPRNFYVYGLNHNVYALEYPDSCTSCVIL